MNPNFLEERVLIAGAGAVSAGGVGGLKSFLMLLHLNAKNPIGFLLFLLHYKMKNLIVIAGFSGAVTAHELAEKADVASLVI